MKRKIIQISTRFILCLGVMAIGILLDNFAVKALADQVDGADGVVLVNLKYEEGRWHLGKEGVTILPCNPPNNVGSGSKKDPMVRVLSEDGKLLYEKIFGNPRLLLYEHPEGKAVLLDEASFTLRFAYYKGMQRFEFYETSENYNRGSNPVVTADLREATRQYEEIVRSNIQLPCFQPAFK